MTTGIRAFSSFIKTENTPTSVASETWVHVKNKYWKIYLTVLDIWTGQISLQILYTFYEEA